MGTRTAPIVGNRMEQTRRRLERWRRTRPAGLRMPEKLWVDSVKQEVRLNDNHPGRLDGDDCRRLMVHVVAPVNC